MRCAYYRITHVCIRFRLRPRVTALFNYERISNDLNTDGLMSFNEERHKGIRN